MDSVISVQVHNMLEAAKRCLDGDLAQDYENLDNQVRQLGAKSREAFQEKRKGEYLSIVAKLENGSPLTEDEHRALEMLIVGEARYYLEEKSDFDNWRHKLDRLMGKIKDIESGGLEREEELIHVQALCLEVSKLLPNIIFYLRQKERLQQFTEGTRQMDQGSKTFLADTIKEMIASERI